MEQKKSKVDQDNTEDTPRKPLIVHTRVGRFWSDAPFDIPKQRVLLEEIAPYFTDAKLRDTLLRFLTPEEGGDGTVSKRDMDWLVTNYAKKHQVLYRWRTRPDWPERTVHLHNTYKAWLRQYRRYLFDIFCRGQRVYTTLDGKVYETTVGQLHFLYWADMHGVIAYLLEHYNEVSMDHRTRQAQARAEKKTNKTNMRKRHELTKAPVHPCRVVADATEFRWI